MSDIERLGTGNPDGALFGLTAAEKIGHYGKTPAIQPVTIAALTPTTETTTTIATCVNTIIADLKTLGLIANA
jgi:hypothetical protein